MIFIQRRRVRLCQDFSGYPSRLPAPLHHMGMEAPRPHARQLLPCRIPSLRPCAMRTVVRPRAARRHQMALLPYTLKSMLQAAAIRLPGRQGPFMAALPEALRKQSQYRPYFDVPSSLEDAPWLLRRFPEVTRCTGPLEPRLLGCRLLVLDHAGTTLAQALAANIPFLLYWNPETASFTPEALPLLDKLREAGILHDTPESAAAKAAEVWGDVPGWWACPRRVQALGVAARPHKQGRRPACVEARVEGCIIRYKGEEYGGSYKTGTIRRKH
ncbi:MAG: hypothetical protein ACLSTO_06190 [Bilophila wadsworthia]